MPTLTQVRTVVDDFLASKWPTLVARQDAFFATHGRYWQGLRTHSQLPTHTTNADGSTTPDNLSQHPEDEPTSWADAFPNWASEPFPMVLQVDAYNGPQGPGWVATVTVAWNGEVYRRSRNVGPETHRTKAWRRIQSEMTP